MYGFIEKFVLENVYVSKAFKGQEKLSYLEAN